MRCNLTSTWWFSLAIFSFSLSPIRYDLLLGVTRAESYFAFNSDDVQYGIEGDRRSKILKNYVRSTYSYHLNEILATIVNEYTDWERPIQHPINIRYVKLSSSTGETEISPKMFTSRLVVSSPSTACRDFLISLTLQ